MTFTENIDAATPKITSLLKFQPRLRLKDWTEGVDSDPTDHNIWSTPWAQAKPIGLYDNSFDSFDEVETYAELILTKGTWFFDVDTGLLWANFTYIPELFVSYLPSSRAVFAEWEEFFSTDPINWYKNPQSSASEDQEWKAGLSRPPIPSQGNPDLLFGFSPVRVTQVQLAIGDGTLLDVLHDWSLNGSLVKIWECAGPLETGNISEVFTGVAGSYDLSGGVLSFEVTDPMDLISQPIDGDYYNATDFPGIDPSKINSPIRQVYGCVQGFVPVNIDFDKVPAVDNNRNWVVSAGQANKAQLVLPIVAASLLNDNDKTEVSDATGIRSGDNIVVEQSGAPTYDIVVFSVDYTTNVITHTFIAARTISPGDEIRRGFIGSLTLDDGAGSAFQLSYERDWTEQNFAGDTKGFTLADDFEANLSGGPALFEPGLHNIYATVYGSTLVPKKLNGIDDFCPVSPNGGALANPVGLLWKILREQIRTFDGLVLFDETAWFNLAASMERTAGFALPQDSSGTFGNWKTVIQTLLQGELLRLHIKITGGFAVLTITRDGPTGAADAEASQADLSNPEWRWSYADVYSVVKLSWGHMEQSVTYYYGAGQNLLTATSEVAKFYHRVSGDLAIETYHYESDHASEVLLQLKAILSERRGVLAGVLPHSFLARSIGDTITYGSKFLPGAAIDDEVNTRAMKLQSHSKSPKGITVALEDQKGIEDFTGDWTP